MAGNGGTKFDKMPRDRQQPRTTASMVAVVLFPIVGIGSCNGRDKPGFSSRKVFGGTRRIPPTGVCPAISPAAQSSLRRVFRFAAARVRLLWRAFFEIVSALALRPFSLTSFCKQIE
jgi:hypothetical protein